MPWCRAADARSRAATLLHGLGFTTRDEERPVRVFSGGWRVRLNVAKALKLSRLKTLYKVLLPAAMPYMFTGFRLSLGIAWLVIVAAEMLTGAPGVGGFLWQEYNALIYEHIILCILTIGVVGFALDRLMGLVEQRFRASA